MTAQPDVILVHAHGIEHPRGMGLASHVGLWMNIPAIGVAKTLLYGRELNVSKRVGDWTELVDEHNSTHVISAVVRTCDTSKPVYVSPGHLIDLQHSIDFVLACCRDHRLPVPIHSALQAATSSQKTEADK